MTETIMTPPRYVPPDFFMAHVVNPLLRLIGAPTLTVRGRRSGLPITVTLAPFYYEGATYLVGGGGETHWARNLRAAGHGQLHKGGKHEEFRAVELHGEEHDRVVNAYRSFMGSRAKRYFTALPEASAHPVFRTEPVDRSVAS